MIKLFHRSVGAAPRIGVAATSGRSAAVAFSTTWLQGRPPTVDLSAGTMAAMYYKNVRAYDFPHRDHLVASQQDVKLTVGQFDRKVYAYAKGLFDGLGLKAGDKVALWMTNESDNVVLQLACSLLGVTTVNIDVSLGFDAVLRILEAEGARALVLSPRYGSEMRADQLSTVFAPELHVFDFQVGYMPYSSKRLRLFKFLVSTGTEAIPGVVRLCDLPVDGASGEYEMDEIAALQTFVKPSDIVSISYVPAASPEGFAKGVAAASHTDILRVAATAGRALGLSSSDVVAVTAPLSGHAAFAAGCIAAEVTHAKLVIPSKVFDAAAALEAMTLQRASIIVATRDQLVRLASTAASAPKGTYDLSSLRTGLVVDSDGGTSAFDGLAVLGTKAVGL